MILQVHLPKTNSKFAPENRPNPKRKPSIPTIHFQVLSLAGFVSGRVIFSGEAFFLKLRKTQLEIIKSAPNFMNKIIFCKFWIGLTLLIIDLTNVESIHFFLFFQGSSDLIYHSQVGLGSTENTWDLFHFFFNGLVKMGNWGLRTRLYPRKPARLEPKTLMVSRCFYFSKGPCLGSSR